jgi:hypothetical protein
VQHEPGVLGQSRYLGARGREQRITPEPAPGQECRGVCERASPEADQPLAVEPGEIALGQAL